MDEHEKDLGVISVLLERLNTQRLPRALALKEKVDNGDTLSELDIVFLEKVFSDANRVQPLIDRHPEFRDLVSRLVSLYKEITDKALENEKQS